MRNVKNTVSLAAKQLRTRPVKQQTSGTTDTHRKAQQAQANAATGPLVGKCPKPNAHGPEYVQPNEKRAIRRIPGGEQNGGLRAGPLQSGKKNKRQ